MGPPAYIHFWIWLFFLDICLHFFLSNHPLGQLPSHLVSRCSLTISGVPGHDLFGQFSLGNLNYMIIPMLFKCLDFPMIFLNCFILHMSFSLMCRMLHCILLWHNFTLIYVSARIIAHIILHADINVFVYDSQTTV